MRAGLPLSPSFRPCCCVVVGRQGRRAAPVPCPRSLPDGSVGPEAAAKHDLERPAKFGAEMRVEEEVDRAVQHDEQVENVARNA